MKPELFIKEIYIKDKENIDYSVYPFNISAIHQFQGIKFKKPVTFIVGENGMGKSTLLEAFAIKAGFNAEGGTRNFNFNTYKTHSDLSDHLIMSRSHKRNKDVFFLRAESFYNVASEIQKLDEEGMGPPIINSYGGTSLHEQSHGESFFSLFTHRLSGNGLYIFDEPEAALPPFRQMAMLSRIHELVKLDSQFIITTHSPIVMAYPDADI